MYFPFRTLRPKSPRREAGFTILEAMIALLLTSLVVGMAYASYVFLSRFVTRWQGQMALENTAHRVMRDMTRRAHRAEAVRQEEARWTMISQGESAQSSPSTTYRHRDATLLRNGQPMHGDWVDVIEMSLTVVAPDASSRSEESEVSWAEEEEADEAAWRRPHLRLRLTAATASDTLTLRSAVYLRQPEGWSESGGEDGSSLFSPAPSTLQSELDR